MVHLDFDTEIIEYPKDSDGFEYNYTLFRLAKVLAPNKADDFYQRYLTKS